MRMKWSDRVARSGATILLLSLTLASAASAQQPGVLTGRVTAHEGGAIVGATVRIEGTPFGTLTDQAGSFRFDNLRAGPRVVTVDHLGFQRASRPVNLTAGGTISILITM